MFSTVPTTADNLITKQSPAESKLARCSAIVLLYFMHGVPAPLKKIY